MKLRPIQEQKAEEAVQILRKYGFVYIAGEVRSGKTLTSQQTCELYGAKSVIFLTKKKAIASIESDYEKVGFSFDLIVINDESMHKLSQDSIDKCDLVVHDEHHRFGAVGKPGASTKRYRDMFFMKPQIFLSGTPSPETLAMMYHQLWVTNASPWSMHKTFYKWARSGYVNVKQKHLPHGIVNDWTTPVEDKIMPDIEPYMVKMTQLDAGFETKVEEEILYVKMRPKTYRICERLKKDRVVEGETEVILGDTPAKLQQKLHQLYSGTIKFESGKRMVLDDSKAQFISSSLGQFKLAIFYKFVAELECLKQVFGDKLTTDIDEFRKDKDKHFAVQILSGREGINLSAADYLVFFNIDFSATSYFQARDRLTTKERTHNKVYWIFSEGGLEDHIYKMVSKKKKWTTKHFKKAINN